MSELEISVHENFDAVVYYRVGKRVTSWVLENADLLETLKDIVETVQPKAQEVPSLPLQPMTVPESAAPVIPGWLKKPEAPTQGVSWDDEDGVDKLPIH